jgi:hypothetical protein
VYILSRSKSLSGLRRGSAADLLAGIADSNPAGGMDFCLLLVLCVLSGRCLCDEPIPRPEESYRLWCVIVRDLETLKKKSRDPRRGVASEESVLSEKCGLPLQSVNCINVQQPTLHSAHTRGAVTAGSDKL